MPAGAITLADITSADWSLMLDSTAQANGLAGGIGNVVQGIDDVAQCIQIIMTTPPGSDPFRPTFGCDLFSFLDQPLSRALPAIVAAVYDAIEEWEPRATVLSVAASSVALGQITVTVNWQLNLTGAQPSQSVSATIGAPATSAGAVLES